MLFQGFVLDPYSKSFQYAQALGELYVSLAGKVKPLARNGHRQWMGKPLPSPDGKYLAYEAYTADSNVWMLENF